MSGEESAEEGRSPDGAQRNPGSDALDSATAPSRLPERTEPADIAQIRRLIGEVERSIAAIERAAEDPYRDRFDNSAPARVRGLRSRLATLSRELAEAQAARRADLAKLHIGAKALGLDADAWGAMVRTIAAGRTGSSGDLTAPERGLLLKTLAASGWRPRARPPVRRSQAAETKEALTAKVRALLLDAGRPDAYADAIARKRFAVERWEWLGFAELLKLTAMLAIDQRRRAKRQAPTCLRRQGAEGEGA